VIPRRVRALAFLRLVLKKKITVMYGPIVSLPVYGVRPWTQEEFYGLHTLLPVFDVTQDC
jgi:hypothetical protein